MSLLAHPCCVTNPSFSCFAASNCPSSGYSRRSAPNFLINVLVWSNSLGMFYIFTNIFKKQYNSFNKCALLVYHKFEILCIYLNLWLFILYYVNTLFLRFLSSAKFRKAADTCIKRKMNIYIFHLILYNPKLLSFNE